MSTPQKATAAISRRRFLQTGSLAAAAVAGFGIRGKEAWGGEPLLHSPLAEFGYGDVLMASEPHESQLFNTHAVLMALSEDSLLKPFRQMSGMPAPGEDLGGWYHIRSRLRLSQELRYRFCSGMHLRAMGIGAGARLCHYRRCGDAREGAAAQPPLCGNHLGGLLREEPLSRLHLRQTDAGTARFAPLCEGPAGARDSGADHEYSAAAPAGTCRGT